MKHTNTVCTIRVSSTNVVDNVNRLCKDINSHEHCNVEIHSVLDKTDTFVIKVASEKNRNNACTQDGKCYNLKLGVALSLVMSLLQTRFYTNIEILED